MPTGGDEAISVAVTDFDLDGIPDLLLGMLSGSVTSVRGDGARGFTVVSTTPLTGVISALDTGLFDADAVPDLITSAFGANQVFTDGVFGGIADLTTATVVHPPRGDFSELSRNPDGTYTRRMTDGTEFVFDADGLLLSRSDRNGNTTTYAYDGQGLLTSITDPAGLVTSFDYAASTITDAAGRTTFYLVDADGNLIDVTDPDNSVRQFAYDSNSRLIFGTSERGFTTSTNYGFAGQYIGSGFPDGSSIALDISRDLGLADLGIGLGTESDPAPFGRPENQMAELPDGNGNAEAGMLMPGTFNLGARYIFDGSESAAFGGTENLESGVS